MYAAPYDIVNNRKDNSFEALVRQYFGFDIKIPCHRVIVFEKFGCISSRFTVKKYFVEWSDVDVMGLY